MTTEVVLDVRRRLTEALLEPAVVDPGWQERRMRALDRIVESALTGQNPAALRLTEHDIRTALAARGSEGGSHRTPQSPGTGPFEWSATNARRTLGIASVRKLVRRDARTPMDAVQLVIADSVRDAEGGRAVSSLDAWLAGLTGAARSAVAADAVCWATRLWNALDWHSFSPPPDIGRDHWWDCPKSALLAVRSRADVRTVVPATGADDGAPEGPHPGRGGVASVHLVTLQGPRRPTARAELCVLGLIETFLAPAVPVPGRVVGWWPASGHTLRVEFDAHALDEGVEALESILAHGTRRARGAGAA